MTKLFAYMRLERVRSVKRINELSRHGLRLDKLARENVRPDATAGTGLQWPEHGRELMPWFKSFKERTGARERKNAPKMLNLQIGVSLDWIRETGDLHDMFNPRNVQLFHAAREWVESWSGPGTVIAARMDLDETGGALVDVFACPVRAEHYKNRAGPKPTISFNKAAQELAVKLGYPRGAQFRALQTDWVNFAQAHLDSRLQRGSFKTAMGPDYLPVRQYKAEQEALKATQRATVAKKLATDAADELH